jgi:hypothetical protein
VPLVAGVACFAAFVLWEMRTKHPMLELALFKVRNFAVANLATLTVYAGLLAGFFFITLFLQQTAGYSAVEAGLATTPISVMMFVLSPWFGKLASGTGPRLPMTAGPIVGGIGMLLFVRVGSDPSYVTDVLPAVLLFGLGLSATVAPLTATVLDSVDERHVGIASGINNGVSRVAGLLGIAVLGALIAAQFSSSLDQEVAGVDFSPAAEDVVADAREKPLAIPPTADLDAGEAATITAAAADASSSSFDLGIAIAGGSMILGGIISGIGIRNPERPRHRPESAPRAATAGECGRAPHPAASRREQPDAVPA